jgi:membrane protein
MRSSSAPRWWQSAKPQPEAEARPHGLAVRRWYRFIRRSLAVRRSVVEIIEGTVQRIVADRILDLSAQVSFYFVLSLLPFLIVLAAIVGWIPSTTLWQSFAQWLTDYFPDRSKQAVFATILDLTRGYTGFLSFGLLTAVWSASSGFMSLMEALSIACCGRETRPYWKRRAIATVSTLVASLFCFLGFGLWTVGHWASRVLSAEIVGSRRLHLHWRVTAWWAGTVLLMFVARAFVNHFLPVGKRPWQWLSAGSVFSVAGVLITSIGFNVFFRYSPTVPRVYSVLAGFVVLMTWIYMANLILLVGTEMDTTIRDLQKTP